MMETTRKKQVLLLMPSYYHFDEVITEVLEKYSGHNVKTIDTSPKLVYRNFFDRLVNFFSKVFLNKNLKPEMQRKRLLKELDGLAKVDYLIINRVDLIEDLIFENVVKKSVHKVLLLWDSLDKIAAPSNRLQAFDVVYSFDTADCKKYNFKKIENFHFWDLEPPSNPIYDAVYLGTLDARTEDLKKLIDYLKSQNKTIKAFLYDPSGKKKPFLGIAYLKKIIPFKTSISFAKQATVIIDLAHQNQTGLSFRVFEAMSLGKKLITTNKHIMNYDFYNPNNIFIIADVNQIDIPQSFWANPYEPLTEQLIAKYAAENWVKQILSND